MLKQTLLGGAMLLAAPALAQVQTIPLAPSEVPSQAAPEVTATAPADPAQAMPEAAAPATGAAIPPPADQVAAVVDQNFATYDKDGNGQLSEVEFGAWMVALKSQTDPRTDANAPATKQWNRAAFAQADTNKSKSLDKAELTGFLSPAAKS